MTRRGRRSLVAPPPPFVTVATACRVAPRPREPVRSRARVLQRAADLLRGRLDEVRREGQESVSVVT